MFGSTALKVLIEGQSRGEGLAYLASISGSAWKNSVAGEGVLVRVPAVGEVGEGSLKDGDVGLV
jgi:hypothetical protein